MRHLRRGYHDLLDASNQIAEPIADGAEGAKSMAFFQSVVTGAIRLLITCAVPLKVLIVEIIESVGYVLREYKQLIAGSLGELVTVRCKNPRPRNTRAGERSALPESCQNNAEMLPKKSRNQAHLSQLRVVINLVCVHISAEYML